MAKQGKTTGNLKMRSGPGMQFDPPIAYLVPDTPLEILGEEGDWWKVRAQGKEGYVGKKYVAVTEAPAEPAKEASATTSKADDVAGGRLAGDRGRAPTMPARPGTKPAPPKGIVADASAVEPTKARKPAAKPGAPRPSAAKTPASRPSAPKPSAAKTPASRPSAPKPKGPQKK
jgi:hypothetical protein